ncbi:Alpha/Beta hydrolase protein [Ampelomyces quisqualis]|uniref:Alpha/Beta hydrolase protein n=1 Tax=Ampelomyces quisqualis TaxID=50730 RepID=A0A6A5R0M4_AMPQU|nr:Alpha/Beta hydrolase protein [Ampelomyces quisqualis]
MPFGPFALTWFTPPPKPNPLPPGIHRTSISTPSGPLELLYSLPPPSSRHKPALLFAHGGFGCAAVWTAYMQYFSARGYACYAVSYRGHGGSWYPSMLGMYFTVRRRVGEDLCAGVRGVEGLERARRKAEERVDVVLVAHSAGGALSQYVLSRGMCTVQGLCLLAGVPAFGSWSCYTHWLLTAPIHFIYRFFHSRYLLATTAQVHSAFFTRDTPRTVVRDLERLLAPYESMMWPMQALLPFVTGPDVLTRITGWKARKSVGDGAAGITPRLLVLAAEHDVLCTPSVLQDAAERYRAAFYDCVRVGILDGVSEYDARIEESDGEGDERDGVAFTVVKGLGHHLQNHVEWERGAEVLLKWANQL